jgi:hypothetical protein
MNELIPYRKGDLWGYCDKNKNIIIEPKYISADPFSDGFAIVETKDGCSYIDKNEKKYEIDFEEIWDFNEGMAMVEKNSKIGFINNRMVQIIPCEYDDAYSFQNGFACVGYGKFNNKEKFVGKYGIINSSNTPVIEIKYEDIDNFDEGYAFAKENGKYGYIDENKSVIIPFKYDNAFSFSEGLALVKLNNRYFYLDIGNNPVIKNDITAARIFSEGLALIKEYNVKGWKVINKQGEEKFILFYEDFGFTYEQGLLPVKNNRKWGYINKDNQLIISLKYEEANDFENGIALVKLNGREGYIGIDGKEYFDDNQEEKVFIQSNITNINDEENPMKKNIKNLILYGPPGTGKTYNSVNVAVSIIEEKEIKEKWTEEDYKNNKPTFDELTKKGRIEFITFHQSYSYEEFVEGIKPEIDENTKQVIYNIKPGIFKEIVGKAKIDLDNKYVLIIDEINRGNVSKIFGELITLIENDKRIGEDTELMVTLPYSKEIFGIPPNLYIIGTMNTADRSVEALDTALRRRFGFIEYEPDLSCIGEPVDGIDLKLLLKTMNERIELVKDRDHRIGHSYLMKVKTKKALIDAFKNNIIPLLQEYFFSDWGKIRMILGDTFIGIKNEKDDKVKFAVTDTNDDYNSDYNEKKIYTLNKPDLWDFESIYAE